MPRHPAPDLQPRHTLGARHGRDTGRWIPPDPSAVHRSVLAEPAEALKPEALAAAASLCPVAWVQRLGWLLERVDQPALAEALLPEVAWRATVQTCLLPSASGRGAPRDDRWRLIVNTDVEPDDL